MTHRLILMRHAKTKAAAIGQDDYDRRLTDRGKRDAKAAGDWLRENGLIPDTILCSAAERTRETCACLGFMVPPHLSKDLYHAGPAELWQALSQAQGETVLIIGHNPSIALMARQVVAGLPSHPRFGDFPTTSTLVAEFEIAGWERAGPGQGRATHFATPQDFAPQD